jgi:hypothetical protein
LIYVPQYSAGPRKINRSKIIAGQVGLNEYGISVPGPKSNSVGKTSHILHPSSAIGFPHTAALAGQDALIQALLAIVKPQQIEAGSEPHVMFVKDGSSNVVY